MKIYLAGQNGKWRMIQQEIGGGMKIFLAGDTYNLKMKGEQADMKAGCTPDCLFVLESFYDCRKNAAFASLIPTFTDFLLDSGAFTFMSNKSIKTDWERYVDEYADFINAHKIDKFFELDIDSVVGLERVESLRKRLEQRTGRQAIPVWHPSRGIDYYDGMVREYPYVAYGGLITDGVKKTTNEKAFPYFIAKAHENGAKIHGLGYTACANLRKYKFDSVDSTAWLYGNLGGYLYKFNPGKESFFEKIPVPAGKRLAPRPSAEHNFKQWRYFQQYAFKNL